MKTYEILISVTTAHYVQVEAENEDQAYDKYYAGEVLTDPYGEYSVESEVVEAEEMND